MSDGESEDGRPPVKKRKASRACDRCNSQHQPCDNASPKCSVCVRAGTECTYNRPVRKRGPRSGYTGQNGERLWAIALQARPDIEDVVLQALRAGTYGDTGIPNLEYYRNNENQAELVTRFNESRLGRFLQNGESADLNLPPLDQELPPVQSFARKESVLGQPDNSDPRQPTSTAQAIANHPRRRMSSSSGATSVIVNPHGAPQNPSDIYLQADDIRRRAPNPPQDVTAGYQNSPSMQSTGYTSNGYREYKSHMSVSDGEVVASHVDTFNSVPSISHSSAPENEPNDPKANSVDLGASYPSRWLDSIPRDTLLNLGFAPGEGMEEDFFELCANPDPIESSPMNLNLTGGQGEDEEAVWRRLVMKGRFV
ncbi:hypothetical protein GGS20DRAFT_287026 [Poronia punctata]|nr:hypothetical protein GGS20DRAFT_287026 [Poronia punctata]